MRERGDGGRGLRLHCPHYPLLDALEGPFPKFLRNTRARIAFCSFFLTICFCSAQQWLLEMLASTHRRPLKNCRLSDKGRRKAHTPSSLLCTTGVEEKKKKKRIASKLLYKAKTAAVSSTSVSVAKRVR